MLIHQALHGYGAGHQLLESSTQLGREARRELLTLSDLSGPTPVSGFTTYLTGYALRTDGMYAFARTWVAEEMPRPGSVWTHTLLIPVGDLGAIDSLQSLRSFFLRPRANDFEQYSRPLTIDPSSTEIPHYPLGDVNSMAHGLINALYPSAGDEALPVVIGAQNSHEYEPLILAVWSQQWPALRARFTFCTGSLSFRSSFDGQPFDCQVVPEARLHRVGREAGSEITEIGISADSSRATVPKTVDIGPQTHEAVVAIVSDLAEVEGRRVKEFVWRYSEDLPSHRPMFRSLVDAYLAVQHSVPIRALIEILAVRFPSRGEARSLKTAVAGHPDTRKHEGLVKLDESEVLPALFGSAIDTAYDAQDLDLDRRLQAFWTRDRETVLSITRSAIKKSQRIQQLGAPSTALLKTVATQINGREAGALFSECPDLIRLIVPLNLALTSSPDVWRVPRHIQEGLLETLSAQEADLQPELRGVLTAVIDSETDSTADAVLQSLGEHVMETALDVINHRFETDRDPPPDWRRVVASRPSALLNWLQRADSPADKMVDFALAALDPTSEEAKKLGASFWLQRFFHRSPENPPLENQVFFLVLALRGPHGPADELASVAFQDVWDAVNEESLNSTQWAQVRKVLPRPRGEVGLRIFPSRQRSTSKLVELQQGFVAQFVRSGWRPKMFFRCFKNPTALRETLRSSRRLHEGRDLLVSLSHVVRTEAVDAMSIPTWQLDIIRSLTNTLRRGGT